MRYGSMALRRIICSRSGPPSFGGYLETWQIVLESQMTAEGLAQLQLA